jgi:hypothetical protein
VSDRLALREALASKKLFIDGARNHIHVNMWFQVDRIIKDKAM